MPEDPLWPRASTLFTPSSEISVCDVALLGIPTTSRAITPNRADQSPRAIREALHRYSTWSTTHQSDLKALLSALDFGDVPNPDVDELSVIKRVASLVEHSRLVLALGGDNSCTFAGALGVASAVGGPEKVGVITFDAHHDVRDGDSNGSPIRRLVEAGIRGTNIVQIGISDFANSQTYAERVKEFGITVISRYQLRQISIEEAVKKALDVAGTGVDSIYVDFDMDVCDRSVVPGCPAAAPGGLSADEIRRAAFAIGLDDRVVAADFTEVDTTIDSADQRTVRLTALCILEIMNGLANR
jgi:formiminoglutamase